MASEKQHELELLEALETEPETTQADLAVKVGVAVGTVNWYHQTFNRVFFGVTLLFSLRFVPRGIREFREEREAAEREQTEGRIP